MSNEELAVKAQEGSKEALAALWEQVKKLLYMEARSFFLHIGGNVCATHGVTLEDLQQECYFALCDTVKAYDPQGEYKLTSYLHFHAKGRFRACMGMRTTKQDALDHADTLNAALGEDENDGELGDLIPDQKAEKEVIESVEQHELHDILEAELSRLLPVQEQIVRRRFIDGETRKKAGEALGITPYDVQREEEKARRALRRSKPISSVWENYSSAYKRVGFQSFLENQGSVEELLAELELYKHR